MAASDKPNNRPLVIRSHEDAMRFGRDTYERLPEDAKCALNSLMSYEAAILEHKSGLIPTQQFYEEHRNMLSLGSSADSLRREYLQNVDKGFLKNRCGITR